jgi:hypothetical protein
MLAVIGLLFVAGLVDPKVKQKGNLSFSFYSVMATEKDPQRLTNLTNPTANSRPVD